MPISTIGSAGINQAADTLLCTTSGSVGIGTASPAEKLDVSGNIRLTGADTSIKFVNAGGYDFSIRANAGNALEFYSPEFSANALMSLSNGGNLRINNTNTSLWVGTEVLTSFGFSLFKNSGTPALVWNTNASGELIAFSAANRTDTGNISTNGTTTAYNTTSDYRLKENVAPMQNALATVALLKPCTYKWKSSGSSSQGFIAHELQEVVSDCVNGEKDAVEIYIDKDGNEHTRPKYQSIDTSFLVATLTAAIQEQQALITGQQAMLASLTARIEALENT